MARNKKPRRYAGRSKGVVTNITIPTDKLNYLWGIAAVQNSTISALLNDQVDALIRAIELTPEQFQAGIDARENYIRNRANPNAKLLTWGNDQILKLEKNDESGES